MALLLSMTLVAAAATACAPAPSGPATPPAGQGTATPGAATSPVAPIEQAVGPTSPVPTAQPVDLNVYFIYKEKVQAVHRTAPAGTRGVLKAALAAVLAGPSTAEKAAGLTSAVPLGTKLRAVGVSDSMATIDLSSAYTSGGGSLSMMLRIAQVVYTATQFSSVRAVRLAINGKLVTTIGGEGIIVDKPQTRAHWEGQTPAILVEEPAWGGTLREGATVRGTANVFEATFRIRLTDSSGKTVFDRQVMASSGTGTRGRWTAKATLGATPATRGTLRVYDLSAKDGKPENVIDIPVALVR